MIHAKMPAVPRCLFVYAARVLSMGYDGCGAARCSVGHSATWWCRRRR